MTSRAESRRISIASSEGWRRTPPRAFSLGDLARRLGGEAVGDSDLLLGAMAALADAGPADLSHFSSSSYRRSLLATCAGAVILRAEDLPDCPCSAIVVQDPRLAYAKASWFFARAQSLPAAVHRSAVIDPTAKIAATVHIGPFVSVGTQAQIGEYVQIDAGAVIEAGCRVGERSRIGANVVLCAGVWIGDRCIVRQNTTLGSDGFGYARNPDGQYTKIQQLGGLTIGDEVEIGANVSIDRGALGDTVIERGVKIDNQVQIGHNCRIGADSLICGCVGLAGSTNLGPGCVLAGGVGVGGGAPITLAPGVTATGMTHVSRSIEEPGVYAGSTIHGPVEKWKRNALRFRDLDALFWRLRRLEDRVASGAAASGAVDLAPVDSASRSQRDHS